MFSITVNMHGCASSMIPDVLSQATRNWLGKTLGLRPPLPPSTSPDHPLPQSWGTLHLWDRATAVSASVRFSLTSQGSKVTCSEGQFIFFLSGVVVHRSHTHSSDHDPAGEYDREIWALSISPQLLRRPNRMEATVLFYYYANILYTV